MPEPLSPDAAQTWRLLAERIEREENPRARANLAQVARHVEEEVRGDVPALMATLTPQPMYFFGGASSSLGPQGYAAVKAHYEALNATGKNRLEFEVTRVVADDETVVTEGVFRHAYSGQTLIDADLGDESVEPGDWYLTEYRALVVWRISPEGLIEGEDIYTGERPRVLSRLARGERSHLGPVGPRLTPRRSASGRRGRRLAGGP